MYDYGHRLYSPDLGRWITRDPIGERGGLNLYCFNANNTIDLYDILGFYDCSIIKKLADNHVMHAYNEYLEELKDYNHASENIIEFEERIKAGEPKERYREAIDQWGRKRRAASFRLYSEKKAYERALKLSQKEYDKYAKCISEEQGCSYCTHYSRLISITADAASLIAAIEGVTLPVAATIQIIAVGNGLVSALLCKPDVTTITTAAGLTPGWVGPAMTSMDYALNSYLLLF